MRDTFTTMASEATHVFRYGPNQLAVVFVPKRVAVIGDLETIGSVGSRVLNNLTGSSFGGTVYAVAPGPAKDSGSRVYPTIGAVPELIDLALIASPAQEVPAIVSACVDAQVKSAIVLSTGFKEPTSSGPQLERLILQHAQRGRMPVIGPNSLGIMIPSLGLNATSAAVFARPGKVGFISESGALCAAILDWSLRENVGFSAFISIGSMLDVGWGDLISYLGDDPQTRSIVLYMESIGNAQSFLSAAREVALTKPIIVLKAGRAGAAVRAAASHTGLMTGSDEVLDAAFRRCGVLRVNTIAELFYMAEILAKQPRPRGPKLTIVTNAGGPGILAADALIADGGQLTPLSEQTIASLDQILPPNWSRQNPIDILDDADPERYAKAMCMAGEDANGDGLLAVLTPQSATHPAKIAERLKDYARQSSKPILASWMGGHGVEEGEAILNDANIPTFPYPDTAARMFNGMWRYSANLDALYEIPALGAETEEEDAMRLLASAMIAGVIECGRTCLSEVESRQLLAAYRIPAVETRVAVSAAAAVQSAEMLGYPVALKLYTETITHKSDVGGVQLSLGSAADVKKAYYAIESAVSSRAGSGYFGGVTVQPMISGEGYEILIGSSPDPQFGPVLRFGLGGRHVEIIKDTSLALPPLNTTLARRMMEQTRIYAALRNTVGSRTVDLAELEQVLVRFSHLVVEQPWIREIEINPLYVSSDRILALDVRVHLLPEILHENQLSRPVIRPYPKQYIFSGAMKDGTPVTIRPIRPEDEPLMIRFHEGLSDRSIYYRYFHMMKLSHRIAHERLRRICFIDYNRELALVVDYRNPTTGAHEILAVGRLTKMRGTPEAEFAVIVSDAYQGKGLGNQLLRRLIESARSEKLRRVFAEILNENIEMQRLIEQLGFRLECEVPGQMVKAELILS